MIRSRLCILGEIYKLLILCASYRRHMILVCSIMGKGTLIKVVFLFVYHSIVKHSKFSVVKQPVLLLLWLYREIHIVQVEGSLFLLWWCLEPKLGRLEWLWTGIIWRLLYSHLVLGWLRLRSPRMVERGTYTASSCSVGFLTKMAAMVLWVSAPENKEETIGCFMTRSQKSYSSLSYMLLIEAMVSLLRFSGVCSGGVWCHPLMEKCQFVVMF